MSTDPKSASNNHYHQQQVAISASSNFAVKAGLQPGRSYKDGEAASSKRTIADGFRKASDVVGDPHGHQGVVSSSKQMGRT
mmetsp:Transcript_13080/g.17697  ORF Transcript_13080/g.17697 Transcript_13080/m.17697 type:complete len:81 (-) Transcript_13080:1359-1601(-)